MTADIVVHSGLFIPLHALLIGPFHVRSIEQNLEIFLLICSTLAPSLAGFATFKREIASWSLKVVAMAFTSPLLITDIGVILVGITQIVFIVKPVIHYRRRPLHWEIGAISTSLPLYALIFHIKNRLELLPVSSRRSLLTLSLEMICALPLSHKRQVKI